jgi:hypothetical protein
MDGPSEFHVVRPWSKLATAVTEIVSMMRSAQRAAAFSSTSGKPASIVLMLAGRRLVHRILR